MKKYVAIHTGTPTSANRTQWGRLDQQARKRREATDLPRAATRAAPMIWRWPT